VEALDSDLDMLLWSQTTTLQCRNTLSPACFVKELVSRENLFDERTVDP